MKRTSFWVRERVMRSKVCRQAGRLVSGCVVSHPDLLFC